MAIWLLVEFGTITHAFGDFSDQDKMAFCRILQDFLICFEMMVAAIVHLFAFSHRPFVDLAAPNDSCCYSLMKTLDTSDERTDITDHLRQVCKFWNGGVISFE